MEKKNIKKNYSISKINISPEYKNNIPYRSKKWIIGEIITEAGKVPLIRTNIDRQERREHKLVRWNNKKRMNYSIDPGIYGVGKPDKNSPVFVSANYKLSFDILREHLKNINGWILVLNTKGINVWCAAGKGTFGTNELSNKIKSVKLDQIVSHRKIIVPQLGAPGIASFKVKKETGFSIVFGPVNASDIPEFLNNNFEKNERMKTIEFPIKDRFILTPMEFVSTLTYIPFVVILIIILNIGGKSLFLTNTVLEIGLFLVSFFCGTILVPLFLPFIPFRSFALKGWFMSTILIVFTSILFVGNDRLFLVIYSLLFPPISSYLALNFTGASTYTNLSGVVKEMKYSLPIMIVSLILGIILKIYSLF